MVYWVLIFGEFHLHQKESDKERVGTMLRAQITLEYSFSLFRHARKYACVYIPLSRLRKNTVFSIMEYRSVSVYLVIQELSTWIHTQICGFYFEIF